MTKVLRQLGFIETQMAMFHAKKAGTTQGIQWLTLIGQPDLEQLQRGVRFLFEKYQALRCRISETSDGMWFEEGVELAHIPCRIVDLADPQQREISAYVAEVLNRPLDPAVALWGIEAVRAESSVHLLLIFHHAIIDGDGLFKVADALLQHLDGEAPEMRAEPLPRPIDDALRESPPKTASNGSPLAYHASASLADRRTSYRRLTLEQRSSAALRAFAQASDLATNSVLGALVARAFSAELHLPEPVELKSAVSLREGVVRLERDDGLGCYIGIASASLMLHEKSLAHTAREYQRQLYLDVLRSTLRRTTIPYPAFRGLIENIDASGRFVHGLGITNLGPVKLRTERKSFHVSDYLTLNNRNAGNVALVVSALELGASFRLSFAFCEPLMSAAAIERMIVTLDQQARALPG